MLDKIIAFVFSVITALMSVFGGSFLEAEPLKDADNPIYEASCNLQIMTFNIKCTGTGMQSEEYRTRGAEKIIRKHSPSVFGIQEATPYWMETLNEIFCDEYERIGVGRSDDASNEANPIFYKKADYDLLDSGTFWLSDTPDIPSNTWGASLNRICTFAVLREKETGVEFAVFNTHFDHVSNDARLKSVGLILSKIAEKASGLPIVLMGDFNVSTDSSVYKSILSGGLIDSSGLAAVCDSGKTGRTFHGYDVTKLTTEGTPIDFIFINDLVTRVNTYEIDDSSYYGIQPSDHYPVITSLTVSTKKENPQYKTEDITAMTYNVYISGTGELSPESRAPFVIENIKSVSPDSFGLQEADEAWIERIAAGLSDYAYVGHGRDRDLGGEASPIFYKKDKFELVDSGTFWLSKTPDKPSRGWDAMLNRVCTYAILKDKETGFIYAHFNAHFDHLGVIARQNSIALVSCKIAEICPNLPIVFSGDLNDSEGGDMYKKALSIGFIDTKKIAESTMDCATYHGYSASTEESRPMPIDFIFTNSFAVKADSYEVIKTQYNGNYASDHHPVVSKITFAY